MDQRDLLLLLTFLWGGFKVNLFRLRVHHKDADEFLSTTVVSRQLCLHEMPANENFLARFHTDVLVWYGRDSSPLQQTYPLEGVSFTDDTLILS